MKHYPGHVGLVGLWNPNLDLRARAALNTALRESAGSLTATALTWEDLSSVGDVYDLARDSDPWGCEASQAVFQVQGWTLGWSWGRRQYYLRRIVGRLDVSRAHDLSRKLRPEDPPWEFSMPHSRPAPAMDIGPMTVSRVPLDWSVFGERPLELETLPFGRALLEESVRVRPEAAWTGPLKVLAARGLLLQLEGIEPVNLGEVRSMREEALSLMVNQGPDMYALRCEGIAVGTAAWALVMSLPQARREEGLALLGHEIGSYAEEWTLREADPRPASHLQDLTEQQEFLKSRGLI